MMQALVSRDGGGRQPEQPLRPDPAELTLHVRGQTWFRSSSDFTPNVQIQVQDHASLRWLYRLPLRLAVEPSDGCLRIRSSVLAVARSPTISTHASSSTVRRAKIHAPFRPRRVGMMTWVARTDDRRQAFEKSRSARPLQGRGDHSPGPAAASGLHDFMSRVSG